VKPRIKAVRAESPMDDEASHDAMEEITLAEQGYRALRRDIISGAMEPGQSLRLEYLKERYGISFSPIREALNRLHSERMVVSSTSRGFRVAPLSVEEMWDAIETRILIDCEAMRRSLARADDRWEARLVGTYHALTLAAGKGAGEPQDEDLLEARHWDFHNGLLSACASRWLLDLSAQMYAQTERYRRPLLRGRPRWGGARNVQQEHQDLMDAALARDADKAVSLLAEHYRETGHMVNQAHQALLQKRAG
jgi:GntR family transcriptional regulator, carbon starvation induced regulator